MMAINVVGSMSIKWAELEDAGQESLTPPRMAVGGNEPARLRKMRLAPIRLPLGGMHIVVLRIYQFVLMFVVVALAW